MTSSRTWGAFFDPHWGVRRKMAALPLPVAILGDLICGNRKWGHPRWPPEAEGPPFSSSLLNGDRKTRPILLLTKRDMWPPICVFFWIMLFPLIIRSWGGITDDACTRKFRYDRTQNLRLGYFICKQLIGYSIVWRRKCIRIPEYVIHCYECKLWAAHNLRHSFWHGCSRAWISIIYVDWSDLPIPYLNDTIA